MANGAAHASWLGGVFLRQRIKLVGLLWKCAHGWSEKASVYSEDTVKKEKVLGS